MELKKYKLSDVAKVEISSVDKKTKDGETPVKLCNFTDVYHNWAITSEMAVTFMDASANASEIEKFSIRKGQVAFTKDSETRDDIGIPTYIADDFDGVLLGYHCALVTPDENKLSGKYLNAFMHSNYIQKYFENSASGSGQRYTLSLETLESMPLLLPSLEEQKRIGEIFSSLDKKIALNRAINQNLEALAKQLYDYWFVQFDFPNEEGKPYKSSGGKMVWNEKLKREIPEGWNVKTISEIEGNIITGKTPSTSDEANFGGEIPFITIDDIRKTPFIYMTERTLTEKGADSQSNKFLPEGSLCCSCIGTTGIIGFVGKRGQTNQQINTIVFEDDINKEFLYFSLNLYFQFAKAKTGNILPNMNKEEFSNILVVYPSKDILQRFHTIASALFSQINNNVIELNSLTKQRDELLPLLMNGQVSLNSDLSHD